MTTTEIRADQDVEELALFARKFEGQNCLRAGLSYANQLVLHFGDPQPYRSKKLQGRTRGSWVLEVFATPWVLESAERHAALLAGLPVPGGEVSVASPDEVETTLKALQGLVVSAVHVLGYDLVLRFENRFLWRTLARYAEPDCDLPVWGLLTPERMYLKVWEEPTPSWSRLPSDRPAS